MVRSSFSSSVSSDLEILNCNPIDQKLPLNSGEVEKTFESDELAIVNFTRNDVAEYRCTSENKLAKIEKRIRIGIYGRLQPNH